MGPKIWKNSLMSIMACISTSTNGSLQGKFNYSALSVFRFYTFYINVFVGLRFLALIGYVGVRGRRSCAIYDSRSLKRVTLYISGIVGWCNFFDSKSINNSVWKLFFFVISSSGQNLNFQMTTK